MIIRKVTPLNSPNNGSKPIDLEIEEGKITRLGLQLDNPKDLKEYAFENALISKGWVDLHVHVYFGATDISIRPEQAGLETGVTTLVDCGSAGEANFVGFSEFIAKKSNKNTLHTPKHKVMTYIYTGCSSGAIWHFVRAIWDDKAIFRKGLTHFDMHTYIHVAHAALYYSMIGW